MKSKIFKKLIAGASALAMVAQFGFVLPASAAETYWTEDYTSATTESLQKDTSWTSTFRKDGLSVQTDSDNTKIGSYARYKTFAKDELGSGNPSKADGGQRNAYFTFPDSAAAVNDAKRSVIEFDIKMDNNGDKTNQFGFFGSTASSNKSFTAGNSNYTGSDYILMFTQAQGATGKDKIYVNDGTLGDGITTAEAAGLTGWTNNTWMHVKAVLDFNKKSVVLKITSLDGTASYFDGAVNMGSSADKVAYMMINATRGGNGSVGFDNIVIREFEASDLSETYYTVTYDVDGAITTEEVKSGEKAASIPDTDKPGYIFNGWQINDDASNLVKDISQTAITADTKFTAKYTQDTSYIEAISTVEITGDDLMTIGADANTAAENKYKVVIKGEKGTTITKATLDSKVNDFSVAWEIDGFKTSNDGDGNLYCDGYGTFASKTTDDVEATFNLRKNASMNFFGKLTAAVTYNGKTYTASKYVAAISNTSAASNQILPKAGYPESFSDYPDSLVGYKASSDTYGNGDDKMLGGWHFAGSDTPKLELKSDGNTKYLELAATTSKKSHVAAQKIEEPDTQAIFEQNVRFNGGEAVIALTTGYAVWQDQAKYSAPISLSFSNNALKLNDVAITNDGTDVTVNTQTWYKVVLSVDKTTKTCFVKVYDAAGNFVGGTDSVAWGAVADGQTIGYYSIGLASASFNTSVDFSSYKAYYAVADESKYTLAADQTTLSIPNGDKAELTASIKTAEGYDFTAEAKWSVLEEDMSEGVIVTPDANDSHKATVTTLSDKALAGKATVQVNIGGYVKTIELEITSSAESVRFDKITSSVSIPLDASKTTTAEYHAIVLNGQGENLNREVTLAVYDRTGKTPYTLPKGITFDAQTGILTVTSEAKACTFAIKATGQNTEGNTIERNQIITVHGLTFDFGAGTDDDLVEGYTPITPDSAYSERTGYGIVGTATVGGTASKDNADSDYLEGNITFKANVQKNKFYTVEVTYKGTITAEPVDGNSHLTAYAVGPNIGGYVVPAQETFEKRTYTIPVLDDVMELNFSNSAQIASISIEKEADRTPNGKPTFYTIGDSTLSNNGSWGYYITHNTGKYTELYDTVNFQCNGRGGSQLALYYTSGDFWDRVLKNIRPGDIVMLSNMGTNGGGVHTTDKNVNYYLDAVEALGAKIVLGSYSPFGPVQGKGFEHCYDSETQKFNATRDDQDYEKVIRKIAAEREANDENYLGFVEISRNANAAFNAYVDDYAANNYESRDAAAQAIISAYGDNNHYSGLASELIVDGYGANAVSIPQQIVNIVKSTALNVTFNQASTDGATVTFDATVTGKGSASYNAYVAEYDENKVLLKVARAPITVSSVNKTATVDITRASNTSTFNAFVWDGNMKPYLANTTVTMVSATD